MRRLKNSAAIPQFRCSPNLRDMAELAANLRGWSLSEFGRRAFDALSNEILASAGKDPERTRSKLALAEAWKR